MPYQDFLASGTFVAPANVFGVARIQCWGRGGSGANGDYAGAAVAGGGGGGGAYSVRFIEFIPGRSYTVTIDNTASSFTDATNSDILALANKGGNASGATAGSGGSVANAKGDVKKTGGNGGTGFTILTNLAGGGGGGGAGNYSANGPVGNAGTEINDRSAFGSTEGAGGVPAQLNGNFGFVIQQSGSGGNGGIPAAAACASAAGAAGGSYGGGGGGGSANTTGTTNGAGGSGGPGLVRVEYDIIILG